MNAKATLLTLMALGALAACAPVTSAAFHALEIENRCLGPESRVQIYLNDHYVGDVYNASAYPEVQGANVYRNRMLIPDVPGGTHRWRIVGTGPGGADTVLERPVLEDSRWVLCGA